MSFSSERNHGCRVENDLIWRGMRTVVIENELLRAVVLLDKGADIVELRYKPFDLDVLYRSYNGIVHPGNRIDAPHTLMGASIDYWPGGWQICFPNNGAPSDHAGAQLGFHGEAHMLRWECQVVQDDEERVEITCRTRCLRTPFRLERRLAVHRGVAKLEVEDRIVNESPHPMSASLGQHIVLGRPFLEHGCRIEVEPGAARTEPGDDTGQPADGIPAGTTFVWPDAPMRGGGWRDLSEVPGPVGTDDLLILDDLAAPRVVVRSPRLEVSVEWDAAIYSHLWLWQNSGGRDGAPTYGRMHGLGIEPFSAASTAGLAASVEDGSALQFEPGQERAAAIAIEMTPVGGPGE